MPASMGADTKEKTHHLVKDLLSYTLTKNNIRVEGFVSNPSPTNLQTHVRWSVEALVDDSSELFTNLGEQLHITHENIEVTFIGIANEIFATGINWGRIVAFLAFGGAVSTYCASKEDLIAEVDHVAVWMTDYIDENLRDWIEKEGGWDGFIIFFKLPAEQDNPLSLDIVQWSAYALAGFGLGALVVLVASRSTVDF